MWSRSSRIKSFRENGDRDVRARLSLAEKVRILFFPKKFVRKKMLSDWRRLYEKLRPETKSVDTGPLLLHPHVSLGGVANGTVGFDGVEIMRTTQTRSGCRERHGSRVARKQDEFLYFTEFGLF